MATKQTSRQGDFLDFFGVISLQRGFMPLRCHSFLTVNAMFTPDYKEGVKTMKHTNALIIAAAPELLEALTDLLNWGRDHLSPVHNPEAHPLLVAAHNAIAKATGTK